MQKGSSAHELLGKVLKQAQLSWKDIQPIWLAPAEARAAFDKNSIDAWVIWDPFLSAAKLDAQAQVLIDGTAFPKSYAFYIGNPKFIQQHPHAVSKVLASLNAADQWILQHQDQALSIYTQSTGLAPHIATPVFQQRLNVVSVVSAQTEPHELEPKNWRGIRRFFWRLRFERQIADEPDPKHSRHRMSRLRPLATWRGR